MELDQEVVKHLLGDSLLDALDLKDCGHKGHNPFAFGRRIEKGEDVKFGLDGFEFGILRTILTFFQDLIEMPSSLLVLG